MKCKHCGAEIPDDSLFCEQCGKKQDEGSKSSSNKTIWIAVGVSVAAIAALVFFLTRGGSDTSKESAKKASTVYTTETVPFTREQNPESHLSDPDSLLVDQAQGFINVQLEDLRQSSNVDVFVVALPSIGDANPTDFANRLGNQWNIGGNCNNRGALLLFVEDQHTIDIVTTEGIRNQLTDSLCVYIINTAIVPKAKSGDYSDAISKGVIEIVNIFKKSGGSINGHEYVDLGLPSGTLWATCNVGATKPEGTGKEYAWGETRPSNSGYKYQSDDGYLTKYCYDPEMGHNGYTDKLTTLQAVDDAATANWGSGWHMPTKKQCEELCKYTTYTWTTLNGVKGCLFTGKNGQTLFLPATADYCDGDTWGYYWSSTLGDPIDNDNMTGDGPLSAWTLIISSDRPGVSTTICRNYADRSMGFSVRPVHERKK